MKSQKSNLLAIGLRTLLLPLLAGTLFATALVVLYVQGRVTDSVTNIIGDVLRDEVLHGTLWLTVQVGIVCGVLLWQAGLAARRGALRTGMMAGIVIAIVESGAALWFGAPLLFIIVLAVLIVGSGVYGSYAGRTVINA